MTTTLPVARSLLRRSDLPLLKQCLRAMSSTGTDSKRNLLFALVAYKNDMLSPAQLIAALHAWTADKDRPLADTIVERGWLQPSERTHLEGLLELHLARYGKDLDQSLAAFGPLDAIRTELKSVSDPYATNPREARANVAEASSRYRVLRPHARGNLGEVFVARDEEIGREVALKEIQRRHADDAASRQRFVIEAEVTGGLEHPGIVPIYGLGTYPDGRPYYAMRFIRGESLKQAIDDFHGGEQGEPTSATERAVQLRKLLERFIDVCNAIAYAHARGVLHRDIKPGNIMLGKYGETMVVDWGLAKSTAAESHGAAGTQASLAAESILKSATASGADLTIEGSLIGTPAFMSPEQAAGRHDRIGPASDIYSLGATLYQLLTGKPPFAGDDLGDILHAVQQGKFSHPRAIRRDIPVGLEAICLKAMAREPAERYASAGALAEDVARWMSDEPIEARQETLNERFWRFVRHHRALAQAMVGSLVMIAAICTTAAVIIDGARSRMTEAHRQEAAQRVIAEAASKEAREKSVALERELGRNLVSVAFSEHQEGRTLDAIATLGAVHRLANIDATVRHSARNLIAGWSVDLPLVIRHDNLVSSAVYAPDGLRVLTASEDKTARVWDAATGEPLTEPMTHSGIVVSVAWSPDGSRVVTGGFDSTARVWDATTGKPITPPLRHEQIVQSVAYSPDGRTVLSGSADGTARLWDATTGEPVGEPFRHDEWVNAVAFIRDGARVVTGCKDGVARVWEASTGKVVGEAMRHEGSIEVLAVSADGARLLTGSADKSARIWDLATHAAVAEPLRHDGEVRAVAFSHDGRRALTASSDATGRLWDATTGKPIGEPLRHKASVRSIAFSADGTRIATGGDDNMARLWDATTGAPVGEPFHHDDNVWSVCFNRDGSRLLTGSADAAARLWPTAPDGSLAHRLAHDDKVHAVAFSSDGKQALTASADNTVHAWDAGTGTPLGDPLPYDEAGFAVAFSADGRHMIVGNVDNTARVWDLHERKPVGEPLVHEAFVNDVAISSDGSLVATASTDRTARVWDAVTGKPLGSTLAHEGPVWKVGFSPDSVHLATISTDGSARVWAWSAGKAITKPVHHAAVVRAMQFSPDGKHLLIGKGDGTARVWNATTGEPVSVPLRHASAIAAVAFSPDGTCVVTGSDDQMALVWDIATGRAASKPFRHAGRVIAVAYSPADHRILTGSEDKTARIWNLPPPLPDDSKLVTAWCAARTGSTYDPESGARRLSMAEWLAAQKELASFGRSYLIWPPEPQTTQGD